MRHLRIEKDSRKRENNDQAAEKANMVQGNHMGNKKRKNSSSKLGSAELFMQESKFLVFGNGKDKPPTGFMFEKQQMHGLYFNQSSSKDVALAMVSMRPTPLGPMMEALSLSPEKYGIGRRFYIQTLDDHVLSPDIQEKLVRENPPEGVFKIKGSDHCPFFSKPQSLHKILLEIAQIPSQTHS
ncbi:methylesterase 14, chloroplastic [Olea europaea subsp. europaea]|uniref:Methylesterase 14, chloroplastic n=2 Tax=Olea europaea subsp. europaea TaxID=158383 RepID=A0A8S0SEN5_OLEEU|nr:methylesterase 14, chloroplastic [Olea europaea subsp. europaea]